MTRCPLHWDGSGGSLTTAAPPGGHQGLASSGDGGSQPGPRPDLHKLNQSRNSTVGETRAGKCHGNCVSASSAAAAPGAGGTARWVWWGGDSGMAQSNGNTRVATTGWPRWDGHGNASTGAHWTPRSIRPGGRSEEPRGIRARASRPRQLQKRQSQVAGGVTVVVDSEGDRGTGLWREVIHSQITACHHPAHVSPWPSAWPMCLHRHQT